MYNRLMNIIKMYNRLIFYFILGIVSNVSVIAGIYAIFGEKVYIEYHLEKTIIITALLFFLMGYFSLIYLLSKVFNSNILKIVTNGIIGLFISILGINIVSAITSLFKIVSFNDEIYSCRFFTIYYKYSKAELLRYIETYYSETSTIGRKLLMNEKLSIMKNAKTIRDIKENVEEYCVYEQTAWWPKIINTINTSIDYLIQHPNVAIGVGVGISAVCSYFGYYWFINKYNMYNVGVSVREIGNELTNVNTSITTLSNALVNTNTASMSHAKCITALIAILIDFLGIQSQIYTNDSLDAEQRLNVRKYLLSFIKRLAEIVAPKEVSNMPIEQE